MYRNRRSFTGVSLSVDYIDGESSRCQVTLLNRKRWCFVLSGATAHATAICWLILAPRRASVTYVNAVHVIYTHLRRGRAINVQKQ